MAQVRPARQHGCHVSWRSDLMTCLGSRWLMCHRRSLPLRFLEPRFGTIQILLVLVKASHVNPCSSVLWSCCWFSGGSRSSNQNASWPSLQPVTEMEIASRPHQAKYPKSCFLIVDHISIGFNHKYLGSFASHKIEQRPKPSNDAFSWKCILCLPHIQI